MQPKLRCAVYTRVSTDMQAEKEFNSCEAQTEKIKAFISSQENMEIFRVYSDPGFSGANTNRPALTEMLQDIRAGFINLVIAYKIDRLTRSPKDFYQLIEVFDKHGANFISVTERFDTSTPAGRLLRNIMLTFAQFERELTSERTRDKLHERAKKGMWNGGSVPLGYKNENKRLVIDAPQDQVVKQIYEDYVTTRSLAKVRDNLKSAGITFPSGRAFNLTALSYILRNGVYTGKVRFSKKLLPGNQEPIITQEMFAAAQAIHRSQKSNVKIYRDFGLGGLVRCLDCGSIMSPHYTNKRNGKKLRRFYYYRCTKTSHDGWVSCSTRQVSANRLEQYICDNLKRFSVDKQYIDNFLYSFNRRGGDGHIGSPDSSKNIAENGSSGVHSGLELSGEPPKISPEIFAQTLAAGAQALGSLRGAEKNLACRARFEQIKYSKESIEVRIKGGVPEVPESALGNEKPGANSTGFSSSTIKTSCPSRFSTNYIIPIIIPNVIHQCRKKNL